MTQLNLISNNVTKQVNIVIVAANDYINSQNDFIDISQIILNIGFKALVVWNNIYVRLSFIIRML